MAITEAVVKGVVFDLGGVVIDWNPLYVYRAVFGGDEAKAREFLATVCTPDWNEEQDKGGDLHQATEQRVAAFPDWADEIRAFYGRWIEMVGEAIPGTTELMGELKAAGLPLFALSNWHCETFAQVRHRFAALDLFEEIVLSGAHGCIKPDARFYQIGLERYRIPAANLVFIDDNSRNVAAAAAVGLPALHFTGADKLRDDLIGLGVPLTPRRAATGKV